MHIYGAHFVLAISVVRHARASFGGLWMGFAYWAAVKIGKEPIVFYASYAFNQRYLGSFEFLTGITNLPIEIPDARNISMDVLGGLLGYLLKN